MSERIAVVTGADRGLGQALTAGLLKQGWRVFAGQYMPTWPELETLAAAYPQTLTCMPLDVAALDSVQAAAATVRAATGRVDLLINNAGVTSPTTRRLLGEEAQDYAEMHRLFDVNTLGPIRMVEAFLPLMAPLTAPLNLWRQLREAATAPLRWWRRLTGRQAAAAS